MVNIEFINYTIILLVLNVLNYYSDKGTIREILRSYSIDTPQ